MKFKDLKTLIRSTYRDFTRNQRFLTYQKEYDLEKELALFRKDCHVIDKGINVVGFEKGHGRSVFLQAQKRRSLLETQYADDPSFIWGCQVLEKYNMMQKDNLCIRPQEYVSYSTGERDNILSFMKSRVSCRNFIGDVIPTEIIETIISLAVDAPNGCCRQTTRFYITQNQEIISKIQPCLAGMTCFTNIPCIVVVSAYEKPYKLIDKNLPFVDAALASENLLLAARAFNVFGTICNCFQMKNQEESIVRQCLHIQDSETIVLCIVMGYPRQIPEKPIRANINNVLHII